MTDGFLFANLMKILDTMRGTWHSNLLQEKKNTNLVEFFEEKSHRRIRMVWEIWF